MKAREGLEIGKVIGEGFREGLETFSAGDKQVKGVPLDLQIFSEPIEPDSFKEKAPGADAMDALSYYYLSEGAKEESIEDLKEKINGFKARLKESIINSGEIREELAQVSRERDLWKFVAEEFYKRIRDTK